MLCFFLLMGRYLDHRTRAVARSAAEELAALEVPRATVLVDGAEVVRPITEVAVGDLVRVGDEIAKAGSTGRSTGAHVHFEVWENGRVQNPRKFLGDMGVSRQ